MPRSEPDDGCAYCGLPVAAVPLAAKNRPQAGYCCYGCRFAHAVVQEQGNEGAIRWTVTRLGLAIFFTMNLMAFTMAMWSLDVYDVEADPFQLTLFQVFRWLSMVLAIPVLLLLGAPLLQNAVESWYRRIYSTDALIVLAVVAAYLTSAVNVVRESGTIYFEVGATVLVMITLGRWIEAAGKQKATESLDKLLTLLPETVTRIELTGEQSSISAASITVNDLLRIRAGERFPTDAVIHRGTTSVDEQVFTGECQPVQRKTGERVLAGTVNLDGDILIKATAEFKQGSFGRLLKTLQDARSARGYHQCLADQVAQWFFPAITVVALATFTWHFPTGTGHAIQAAMSVLLIACPCALGLATPLAIWTALSTAVKHQVLFRSGEAVERLAVTRAICLDKTGTLTTGVPRVFQTAYFGVHDAEEALELAQHMASSSSHPFSKAVATHATNTTGMEPPQDQSDDHLAHGIELARPQPLHSIRTVAGGGVEAFTVDGRQIRLGSVEFSCCKLHDDETSPRTPAADLCVGCKARVSLELRIQLDRFRMAADQQSASIVLLSIDRMPTVGFLIAESIRLEARTALRLLATATDSLHVLSGDRPSKGRFLREQLNVPELNIECSLNPEQKVSRIRQLRAAHGTIVMVGDGINDAPALAASDVGIAMGCGADVSRDSAEVCLLGNDLSQIPWALDLAKRTRSVIRQNLFWAFSYNAVGVCLAATGMLNPAISAGLMIGSSLLVISNSLRLLRDEPHSTSSNSTDVDGPPSDPTHTASQASQHSSVVAPPETAV